MTITITPFTFNIPERSKLLTNRHENKEQAPAIVYWGIYLNNVQISYTSSKELAEQTKLWMEKWFRNEI